MLGEAADDGVDGFFEDRFGLEFVDGGRSGGGGGATARLDRVVVIVMVMMIWAASCCRAGGSSPRCRHPSRRRRLVRPAFDGFRAIDDRAATTRPGYWPSGLVMLHHPVDEKFNKTNKQPKH